MAARRSALVGLQAAEDQVLRSGDQLCQRHGVRPRRHAAARRADIDLDQNRKPRAGLLGRRLDRRHLGRVIDADRDLRDARQCREARELAGTHHLVADQDVGDAAPGEDFRLTDFLHALAYGAARHLQPRDHRRFVGLGMGAQLRPGRRQQGGHAVEVVFEGIEVDHQRRRVDLVLTLTRLGWRRLKHGGPFRERHRSLAA
jgi:hypothetical protein